MRSGMQDCGGGSEGGEETVPTALGTAGEQLSSTSSASLCRQLKSFLRGEAEQAELVIINRMSPIGSLSFGHWGIG